MRKAGLHVGCDCDRYIEFWNSCYAVQQAGRRHIYEAEKKNIDTGWGLSVYGHHAGR